MPLTLPAVVEVWNRLRAVEDQRLVLPAVNCSDMVAAVVSVPPMMFGAAGPADGEIITTLLPCIASCSTVSMPIGPTTFGSRRPAIRLA